MVDRVSAASYAMLCLREEIDRASFHALLRLQALSADQAFQTVGIGRAGRSIARADIEVRDNQSAVVAIGRGTYSTFREAS